MRKFEFSKVVGNSLTVSLLQRALTNKTFPQISIFGGTLGTGKSTCAGIVAMSLTCQSPYSNGQPCLKCSVCQANKKALEDNSFSSYVKVFNVGAISSHKDVKFLIEEVFDVQGNPSGQVYIFEECHRLKDVAGAQTALLAELDRIPVNVYVIMCTTKVNDVDETIRSRALTFQFNRLNWKESRLLLKTEIEARGGCSVPVSIADMVVKASNGIPRNLIKYLDFVLENDLTLEEFSEFVQEVSSASFIQLLSCTDFASFYSYLEELLNERDHVTVATAFKSFLMECLLLLETNKSETFLPNEKRDIKSTMSSDVLWKIISVVEKLTYTSSETDFKIAMMKIFTIKQGTSLTSVVANTKTVASFNHAKAMSRQQDIEVATNQNVTASLAPLSLNKLLERR